MHNHPDNHQLATELRIVISRLFKKLRSKSKANENLSLTERSTLALLDQHNELMPSELASMEKITSQSMSQILGHLAKLGYVHRRVSKQDKRKAIVSLSEAGQHILYTVRNERDEWLQQALEKTCQPQEWEILSQSIGPLTRLVDFE